MPHNNLTNNISGTACGSLATIVAHKVGWINANIEEAIIAAIIGGIVGFIVNEILKWLKKKIVKWLKG